MFRTPKEVKSRKKMKTPDKLYEAALEMLKQWKSRNLSNLKKKRRQQKGFLSPFGRLPPIRSHQGPTALADAKESSSLPQTSDLAPFHRRRYWVSQTDANIPCVSYLCEKRWHN
jgi:hypothetical protein